MPFLSKYGVARHIYIAIRKAGSANHAASGDWTPAAGDVKISKDGGAAANVTNLPTAIAMGNSTLWDFSLTATELQAAQVVVTVADSATKAVDDTGFEIATYGNASAQHAADFSDSVRLGLTALPNANAGANGGLPLSVDAAGRVDVLKLNGTSQTARDIGASVLVGDKTGFSLSAAGVQAIWDALSTALTTVGSIGKRIVDFLTGDIFGRLGAPTGASIAADIAANLTAINNLNNLSALANLYGSAVMEIPDSVTVQYPFTLVIRDTEGHLVDLDASPTVTATNGAGLDRSANLSAIAHGSTGVYTFTYGVAAGAAEEGLRVVATGAVSASARRADFNCSVVDYDSITILNAIKAKTDNLPASPAATGDAMTLTAGERDAVAAALLDLANGVETNLTVRKALRGLIATCLNKSSNSGATFRDFNDTKNRVTATMSGSDRTAVAVDLT